MKNNPKVAQVMYNWLPPVIRGFVNVSNEIKVGDKILDFALISRSSHERAGRRYTKRGVDSKGKAVNYSEAEQIFATPTPADHKPRMGELNLYNGIVTTFIQLRGSIPLKWTQKPNLAYNPPMILKPGQSIQNSVFKQHFTEQLENYNRITIVSLVQLKGKEGAMANEYKKYFEYAKDKNVAYIPFDLHKEVGHTRYENLQKLFDQTDRSMNSYGLFCCTSNSKGDKVVKSEQTGVLRTNCKDNLDRTNLVQTRFAIHAAWKQLEHFLTEEEIKAVPKAEFERPLKLAWADNGDEISIQYAGTPAMRGEATRTGKATFYGAYCDVVNSITRYYINNFEDGRIQDALDLLLSKKQPIYPYADAWKSSPEASKQSQIMRLITTFMVILFRMLQPSSREGFHLILCIFWMIGVFITWKIFRLNPNAIVDRPRLPRKLKEVDQAPEGNNYKIIKKES